jgi:beta-lactamase class A
MYPASVVKMFYLAYAGKLLEEGKLTLTEEFDRALTDMIVDSNNDATGLVLDIITDTTGGPELPPKELEAWLEKRRVVNRWLASIGITGINAANKTWNEGPYGRERQGYGKNYELRNMLTPNSCAKLMTKIALHELVSAERSMWYQKYLNRVVPADGGKNGQATNYIGKVLPKGSRLFSKAGWVTSEKHDVAHIVLPNGHEYVLAIFTKKHGGEKDLLPFLATRVLQQLEPDLTLNK